MKRKPAVTRRSTQQQRAPRLLAGGNPQIPKGEGDAPVQAYIAAVPGWKQSRARWVDRVISRSIPEVRKAVKYNSPLYGAAGRDDWFLGMHCFDQYLKVSFFNGAGLEPVPPGPSRQKLVRYLDLRETDHPDETQFVAWIKQACKLPGEKL